MIERNYTIPLRRGFRNAPKYYRTNKAMATLRAFLVRHMKVSDDNVRIGQYLNEIIWLNGIKNPPARVKVVVKKTDEGIVYAELEGKTYKESVKVLPKTEAATGGLAEKLQNVMGGKEDKVVEEKTAEKKNDEKEITSHKEIEKEEKTAEEKPVKKTAEEKPVKKTAEKKTTPKKKAEK